LFGSGAYNPRGKTLSDAINRNQHVLLQKDIEQYLEKIPQSIATYWEGASIWENSSSEKGFVLAFREEKERGLELSIDLARSYNQGAIYQFSMIDTPGSWFFPEQFNIGGVALNGFMSVKKGCSLVEFNT
jgi:hypothetical protein